MDNDDTFIPISIPESPGNITLKQNITGYPRVVRDLVANVYNDVQKWNDLLVRTSTLIKEIASSRAEAHSTFTPAYEEMCLSLTEAVDAFQLLSKSLEKYADQMHSLSGVCDAKLFLTWPPAKFVDNCRLIARNFAKEYELKRTISEQIIFARGKDEALFLATCFMRQPYMDTDVQAALEGMLLETGHRH